jgi:RES domain
MTHLNKIVSKLDYHQFNIPVHQIDSETFFPKFLQKKLLEYEAYCKKSLLNFVDESIHFEGGLQDVVVSKIEKLVASIIETVEKYYEGRILEATNVFNNALENIFFHDLQTIATLPKDTSFYRARKNESIMFSKEDLFHVKFEMRHIVSTNRYSVPGFPALYLADSTYTCWEEFNQHKLRDLYFSRFTNDRDLNIVRIEKISDFLEHLDLEDDYKNLPVLLSYFVLFPLMIACSIKVRHPSGSFKPEYIIPQLLLQFISKNAKIDGLKFPSTRIDYSKLTKIKGYNYVFPVKSSKPEGFCDVLTSIFGCTEPTSLELEEIINNPIATAHKSGPIDDGKCIELIRGINSKYHRTSFGKIEYRLLNRKADKI